MSNITPSGWVREIVRQIGEAIGWQKPGAATRLRSSLVGNRRIYTPSQLADALEMNTRTLDKHLGGISWLQAGEKRVTTITQIERFIDSKLEES